MKKFILLFSLIILLVISGFLLAKDVRAGTGENVSGFAWSENIGWISFNSLNCDADGNGSSDGTPAGCPAAGTPITNYGVNVDLATGNFSATSYAWSENIGWIWFAPIDTTPDGTVNPAKLDLNGTTCGGVDRVCGWARACAGAANADCTGGTNPASGGWDGWIHLRGTGYGVWRDTGVSPNEFRNWAWSDNVIGWMSFNCSNQGVCASSNYKVFITGPVNLPPSATSLNVSQGNYCFSPSPPVFLNWTFSDPGDTQSAYQVQVDNNSGFPSPEIDTGKVSSTSTTYAPPGLAFSTTYYWRVMVWDSKDLSSSWAVGPSFPTSPRPPRPGFTFAPPSPSAEEVIQFTDQTTFYGTGPSWAWDFNNDGINEIIGSTPAEQNPTWSYSTSGPYTVKLTATDSNGSCPDTQILNVALPLPQWREVAPTSWLERFLANIFRFFRA